MHPEERFLPMGGEAFVKECSLWIGFDEPTIPAGQLTLADLWVYQDEDYHLEFIEDLDQSSTPDPDQTLVLSSRITDEKITYCGRVTQERDYDVLQCGAAFRYCGERRISGGQHNTH